MKVEQFNELTYNLLNDCIDIMDYKQSQYSENDDRLSAFKLNFLNDMKETKEQVLWGMLAKHLNSIYTMVARPTEFTHELWHEKIIDTISYLCLLWGLINEEV